MNSFKLWVFMAFFIVLIGFADGRYRYRYYGGGGGFGGYIKLAKILFPQLFGARRPNYSQRYYGYNYGYNYQGYCRVSQFVDYVGRTPRFYCDCPPYPPNYQWNQCVPMYVNYG